MSSISASGTASAARYLQAGQQALRQGRYSERGRVYHITTATRRRELVFAALEPARILVRELQRSDRLGYTNTLAFVVMPDHLHWLFELASPYSLQRVVGRVKGRYSRIIGQCGHAGGIWQEGFYDHALRRDEDLQGVSRYIVANPLRAGLVEDIRAYPHWDAIWLTGKM